MQEWFVQTGGRVVRYITHLPAVELPPRQELAYKRPPIDNQTWVPRRYIVE